MRRAQAQEQALLFRVHALCAPNAHLLRLHEHFLLGVGAGGDQRSQVESKVEQHVRGERFVPGRPNTNIQARVADGQNSQPDYIEQHGQLGPSPSHNSAHDQQSHQISPNSPECKARLGFE